MTILRVNACLTRCELYPGECLEYRHNKGICKSNEEYVELPFCKAMWCPQ